MTQFESINPNRWSRIPLLMLVASGQSAGMISRDLLARIPAIAINDSWKLAPHAEILYAADAPWWRYHDYVHQFSGERWTQDRGAAGWPEEAAEHGIHVIKSLPLSGVSTNHSILHTGSNSGFQALNMAILGGAKRIALVGYDMGGPHWFGDHPGHLNRSSPYGTFRKAFEEAAEQISNLNVEVFNCSKQSSLTCFPLADLRDLL